MSLPRILNGGEDSLVCNPIEEEFEGEKYSTSRPRCVPRYQIQCDPSVPVSRNRLITGTRTPAMRLNGFLRSIKAQAPFREGKIPIQICISRARWRLKHVKACVCVARSLDHQVNRDGNGVDAGERETEKNEEREREGEKED